MHRRRRSITDFLHDIQDNTISSTTFRREDIAQFFWHKADDDHFQDK